MVDLKISSEGFTPLRISISSEGNNEGYEQGTLGTVDEII